MALVFVSGLQAKIPYCKGIVFFFNFPSVLLLFISLMHFSYNESLLLLFIFLLKSCQKNVDWTEKMNCRDQNVSRRRM